MSFITGDYSLRRSPHDIITRLKFISTFQIGEKINIQNMRVETDSILTPLRRFIFGESREKTLLFITNTIERSFDILHSRITDNKISEQLYCQKILSDFVRCLTGLKNIQQTYKDDKLFYCTIDTILESIETRIQEYKLTNSNLLTEIY